MTSAPQNTANTRSFTHDVVIVGYIGQFDMLLAWLLTRLRAMPLVFNPLLSLYDTFCNDKHYQFVY